MWKVPKKNISSKIADIVRPGELRRKESPRPSVTSNGIDRFAPLERDPYPTKKARGHFPLRRFVLGFLGAVILFGGATAYYLYRAQHVTLASVGDQLQHFYGLLGNRDGVALPANPDDESKGTFSIDSFGEFFSLFKNLGKNYKNIQLLSSNGLQILTEVKSLEETWMRDATHGNGEAIITHLERIQTLVRSVASSTHELKDLSFAASFLPVSEGTYFDADVDLQRIDTFLTNLIAWLKEDEAHHILVFLENPSEVRPGGGFLGSYVELTVRKGSIEGITAHDINDADKVLDRKVVPPKPLQLIVHRFRAADANWFFDFPTSASTTVSLLESSDLYKKDNITFDIAMGVSGKAVEDVLALTGPLKLKNGTTVTSENFLEVFQESVQNGQQAGADDPKSLLRTFAPELITQVSTLPPEKIAAFAEHIQDWIAKREVRIYAKEGAFEQFFAAYNLAGAAYQIPEKFNGDYLAVVNANIGGAKSDLFIHQNVSVESQLSEEGRVATRLVVKRKHTASDEEPWWYTATNQSYLQVMTAPSAALDYSEGGIPKTILPRPEYTAEHYEIHPNVGSVEKTQSNQLAYPAITVGNEDGKNVFGTWVRTERGETSALSLSYTTHLPARLQAGSIYQFVFEKQSGVTSDYAFQINAPVGYVFEENNLPVYELKTSDPPGRLVVTLTLRSINDSDF